MSEIMDELSETTEEMTEQMTEKNCGEYGRTSRRGFAGAACYR